LILDLLRAHPQVERGLILGPGLKMSLLSSVVRTRVSRDAAEVPTITDIYAGANWHERETAEFFGINFTGHPHLVPLLLPEDADFHPLRKDYKP
jgi:NADH:ubiquinone oxidoreductase subunit C